MGGHTFHYELTIISERVAKLRKRGEPLRRPFLGPVRPRPRPLRLAPRIAHDNEAFSLYVDCSKNRVRVVPVQPVDCRVPVAAPSPVESVEGTTKESVFVGLQKFLRPEFIDIEDVLGFG